jgi:hypothetical protein
MNAAWAGALIGAVLGLVSYAAIRWAAARVEQNGEVQQKQSAGLMRAAAIADLMLFPVIGYFVGPMVFQG